MFLHKLVNAFFLLTIAMVESESPPMFEECCTEKVVGGVSYSLFHDVFHGSIPHQCLNNCVFTRTGTSSPKFCFQRGDLPTECLSEVPVGLIGGSVTAMVLVKSATTGVLLADVTVLISLGDERRRATTDYAGRAIFTLSPHMVDIAVSGAPATIEVSGAGYARVVVERMFFADEAMHNPVIFTFPELREGEHRLVLSWDTDTDLDIYVLQMDKATRDIECKTWYNDSSSCPGVNLDIDVYEYGPETITWTDADNDAHSYMIYVHDYDQGGVAGTGARITLYGETEIEMEVADGDSGELWWVIGFFLPWKSSFLTIDELKTIDPDFRVFGSQSRNAKKSKKAKKEEKKLE